MLKHTTSYRVIKAILPHQWLQLVLTDSVRPNAYIYVNELDQTLSFSSYWVKGLARETKTVCACGPVVSPSRGDLLNFLSFAPSFLPLLGCEVGNAVRVLFISHEARLP